MGVELGARVMTDGGIVVHEGAKAVASSVLEALLKFGLLDGDQGTHVDRKSVARSRYEAGERIMRMFIDAGLNQIKAVDLDSTGGGSGAELSDKAAAAHRRFNDLVRVMGPWMGCLTSVVLHDQQPSGNEAVRNVKNALDRVCVHLRM